MRSEKHAANGLRDVVIVAQRFRHSACESIDF